MKKQSKTEQQRLRLFNEYETKRAVKEKLPGDEAAAELYYSMVEFFSNVLNRQTMRIHTCKSLGYFLKRSNRSGSTYYFKTLCRLQEQGFVTKEGNDVTLLVEPRMLLDNQPSNIDMQVVAELLEGMSRAIANTDNAAKKETYKQIIAIIKKGTGQ